VIVGYDILKLFEYGFMISAAVLLHNFMKVDNYNTVQNNKWIYMNIYVASHADKRSE
jgi:hypothetical protein